MFLITVALDMLRSAWPLVRALTLRLASWLDLEL
jgi:hypothetical protein